MSRRAPRYYGSRCDTQTRDIDYWLEVADHEYMCPVEEVMMVSDYMEWYVKKGTAIKPADATYIQYFSIVPDKEPDFTFATSLYACDLDEAPEFRWQNPNGTSSSSFRFFLLTETAVYRVCTLTVNLSCIPRKKFDRFTNSKGEQFWRVKFKHQMTLVNEVSEVLYEQKRQGGMAIDVMNEGTGVGF